MRMIMVLLTTLSTLAACSSEDLDHFNSALGVASDVMLEYNRAVYSAPTVAGTGINCRGENGAVCGVR